MAIVMITFMMLYILLLIIMGIITFGCFANLYSCVISILLGRKCWDENKWFYDYDYVSLTNLFNAVIYLMSSSFVFYVLLRCSSYVEKLYKMYTN